MFGARFGWALFVGAHLVFGDTFFTGEAKTTFDFVFFENGLYRIVQPALLQRKATYVTKPKK